MKKRGQFFLVDALIVVVIVIGLATVYTSVQTGQEDPSVESLSKEISFEGAQVIDYGVFNIGVDIEESLNELGETYASLNPDSRITIIYFDEDDLDSGGTLIDPTADIGSIMAGGPKVDLTGSQQSNIPIFVIDDNTVGAELNNQTYEFDTREGKNFFIVVTTEGDDETHVAQSP